MALKDYLLLCLGTALTSELNWTNASPAVAHIIDETLTKLDLSAEPSILTKEIKAVAKIELFKAALKELSTDIDISGDGVSLKRSSVFTMVQKLYEDAYLDGMVYLPGYQIGIGGFDSDTTDPYSSIPYWERDL